MSLTMICPQHICNRRYGKNTGALRHIFSEFGLIKYRIAVEARWLQQLSRIPQVTEVPPFSAEATAILDTLASGISMEIAQQVSTYRK